MSLDVHVVRLSAISKRHNGLWDSERLKNVQYYELMWTTITEHQKLGLQTPAHQQNSYSETQPGFPAVRFRHG